MQKKHKKVTDDLIEKLVQANDNKNKLAKDQGTVVDKLAAIVTDQALEAIQPQLQKIKTLRMKIEKTNTEL